MVGRCVFNGNSSGVKLISIRDMVYLAQVTPGFTNTSRPTHDKAQGGDTTVKGTSATSVSSILCIPFIRTVVKTGLSTINGDCRFCLRSTCVRTCAQGIIFKSGIAVEGKGSSMLGKRERERMTGKIRLHLYLIDTRPPLGQCDTLGRPFGVLSIGQLGAISVQKWGIRAIRRLPIALTLGTLGNAI